MSDSEIDIASVAPDGAGRGTWRRKEAIVPGTLAGERAAVSWNHVAPHRAFGRLRRVLRAAPERVEVRCPHFLRCGGCDLLHARRDHQLALKRRWLADILGREVEPVQVAEDGFGYRALAKLVVGPDGTLGSYAPRSHDVVSMHGCLIHMPVIEGVADGLRRRWAAEGPPPLRFVVVRAIRPTQAEHRTHGVSLVAPPDADLDDGALRRTAEALAEDPGLAWLELRRAARSDDVVLAPDDERRRLVDRGPLVERLGPVEIHLAPEGFSQVHPAMAERLFAHAVAELQPAAKDVADLYAGAAVLARWALAEGAVSALAVEPAPGPVPPQSSLRLLEARTEGAFEAWKAATHVFVNPPRRGLGPEVVAQLRRSAARRIVYVSCGPQALTRDLEGLSQAFAVERIRPFDLFPQTRHVETVVTLRRLD